MNWQDVKKLFLLDTAFLIDLINGHEGAAKLARRIDSGSPVTALSVISAHEYLFGVYFKYHNDKERLEAKLSSAQSDLSKFEIVPLTREIMEVSASIEADLVRAGRLVGINDVYIAATALTLGFTLVTRNIRHFGRVPKLEVKSY